MRYLFCILIALFLAGDSGAGQILRGSTAGGGGGTPPTYVNSISNYGVYLGAYTPAASGNVLVVCGSGTSTMAATTISTIPAITFTAMTQYGAFPVFARCYWGVAASASAHEIELNGTLPDDAGFVVYEVSGVNTSTRTDGEAGAVTTSSTSFSSGNLTTTGAALLIGYTADGANTSAITWGSGWTERQEELGHVHGGATNSQSSAGTFVANGTRPSAATQTTIILALKGN